MASLQFCGTGGALSSAKRLDKVLQYILQAFNTNKCHSHSNSNCAPNNCAAFVQHQSFFLLFSRLLSSNWVSSFLHFFSMTGMMGTEERMALDLRKQL